MKKYSIWVQIEETSDRDNNYNEAIHGEGIGPDFDTLEEAHNLMERIIDCVTDDGEFVLVPPRVDKQE